MVEWNAASKIASKASKDANEEQFGTRLYRKFVRWRKKSKKEIFSENLQLLVLQTQNQIDNECN